jgi:hypothetical protein
MYQAYKKSKIVSEFFFQAANLLWVGLKIMLGLKIMS